MVKITKNKTFTNLWMLTFEKNTGRCLVWSHISMGVSENFLSCGHETIGKMIYLGFLFGDFKPINPRQMRT